MTSLEFAQTARLLGIACRRMELKPPSFRCPPRIPGTSRSIRKLENGYVVAVEIKNRPAVLVQEDMIRGIMAGNGLYYDDYVFLDALRAAVLHG